MMTSWSDAFGFANTTTQDSLRMEREFRTFFELVNGKSPLDVESYRQAGFSRAATGLMSQEILSTPGAAFKDAAADKTESLVHRNRTIETTLQGMGVKWLRNVVSYDVDAMRRTLEEAFTTELPGLKVIIAEGECQLERQRRVKPWLAAMLKRGQRVVDS